MITPIQQLIPEKNLLVFAPHYDDAFFLLGNYAFEMERQGLLAAKNIAITVIFSRSNYLAGTGAGNFDTGLPRLKLATGHRLLEDINCLNETLGEFEYEYRLCHEKECFVREKPFADSEMEFPQGDYSSFNAEDHAIMARMCQRIRQAALQPDTALIFPLALKEHIDHFIVREAAVTVARELGQKANAAFYFQEDKPYGGLLTEQEAAKAEAFVQSHPLRAMEYPADPARMIEMAFRHYVSQVEEVYRTGIQERALALGEAGTPCDRIYRYAF